MFGTVLEKEVISLQNTLISGSMSSLEGIFVLHGLHPPPPACQQQQKILGIF